MKRITLLYTYFLEDGTPAIVNHRSSDLSKEISPFFDYINRYREFITDSGYEFDNQDISLCNNSANNQIYVFDLMRSVFKNCVYKLPKSAIDRLKTYCIPILFYFPSEGFDFETYFWIDHVQKQLTELGLEKNLKFLMFGTGDGMQQFYDLHIKKYSCQQTKIQSEFGNNFFELSHRSKVTKCFGVNFFEYFQHLKLEKSRYFEKKYQKRFLNPILDTDNKIKDFVCLNRNLRFHRLALVSELKRNKLMHSSHVTLIGGQEMLTPGKSECWKAEEYILKDNEKTFYFKKFIENYVPIKSRFIPDDASHNNIFFPPLQYYTESFYSLVTETEVSEKTLFLTEKTAKPISLYHPFLILGNPFTLKYLRSLGYETFPEFFDESYDEETNLNKRFNMIIEQVIKFKNLKPTEKSEKHKSVIDKLIHNRILLEKRMLRNTCEYFLKSLDEIFDIINQPITN